MTEVVNLNRARKARAQVAADAKAVTNRVAFGRTKSQKEAARLMSAKAAKALDGHKHEP